jgi:hypothetical protein
MFRFFFALVVSLLSWNLAACSFTPTKQRFVVDPARSVKKLDGVATATLAAPVVQLVSVVRGTQPPGGSCSDAGVIRLAITWPLESSYAIDEVGFQFKVVSGQAPPDIFPTFAVTGIQRKGQVQELSFIWLDGAPKFHLPLDCEVEVFAINREGVAGPPTRVKIRAAEL